jgi:hypothetical protein
MPEDHTLFALIAELLRRQFRFYAAITALGIVGIILVHGLTWTTAIVILIAATVIPFGFVLTSFWISVFRGMSQPGGRR